MSEPGCTVKYFVSTLLIARNAEASAHTWNRTAAKNLAALKRALLAKLLQAQKLLLLRSLQLLQSLQKQQKQLKNLSNFSFWNLKKTPQIAEFFIALFYLKLSIR